jgi:hypothetical protein
MICPVQSRVFKKIMESRMFRNLHLVFDMPEMVKAIMRMLRTNSIQSPSWYNFLIPKENRQPPPNRETHINLRLISANLLSVHHCPGFIGEDKSENNTITG